MITLTAEIQIQYANPIVINRNNLISMDGSIFDRNDLKMPSFGLISNTGSIKFADKNIGTDENPQWQIETYAQQRRLTGGMNVSISLNNTLYNRTQQIASFETKQWNYDNESRVVDVSLTSGLEKLQEMNVPDLGYNFETQTPLSAQEILQHINYYLSNNSIFGLFLGIVPSGTSTSNVLNNTFIKYSYIKNKTVWNALQSLAELCQCHIYNGGSLSGYRFFYIRYNGGN